MSSRRYRSKNSLNGNFAHISAKVNNIEKQPVVKNLTDNVITETMISDNAVTTAALAPSSVVTQTIADGAVTSTKLADNSIQTSALKDLSVISTKLAVDAVYTNAIQNLAVKEAKIDSGAVTNTKIGLSAVDTNQLADSAVTTAKISNANVTNAKLASDIDATKITAGTLDNNRLPSVINVATSISAPTHYLNASAYLYQEGTSSIITSGGLRTTSTINCGGDLVVQTSGNLTVTSGYIRTIYAYNTGIASGKVAYVSNTGTLNSAASSRRYKDEIVDYKILDLEQFFKINSINFKYKKDIEELGSSNSKNHVGFLAEDLHDLGFTEFVGYEKDENGNLIPDYIDYIEFSVALYDVVKQQNSVIKSLEERLSALEAKL